MNERSDFKAFELTAHLHRMRLRKTASCDEQLNKSPHHFFDPPCLLGPQQSFAS